MSERGGERREGSKGRRRVEVGRGEERRIGILRVTVRTGWGD